MRPDPGIWSNGEMEVAHAVDALFQHARAQEFAEMERRDWYFATRWGLLASELNRVLVEHQFALDRLDGLQREDA